MSVNVALLATGRTMLILFLLKFAGLKQVWLQSLKVEKMI